MCHSSTATTSVFDCHFKTSIIHAAVELVALSPWPLLLCVLWLTISQQWWCRLYVQTCLVSPKLTRQLHDYHIKCPLVSFVSAAWISPLYYMILDITWWFSFVLDSFSQSRRAFHPVVDRRSTSSRCYCNSTVNWCIRRHILDTFSSIAIIFLLLASLHRFHLIMTGGFHPSTNVKLEIVLHIIWKGTNG